jgi:FkbM family methyltransferase
MRIELLWNLRLLCERLAIESGGRRRLAKLKGTVAKNLNLGYAASLELLEITRLHQPETVYDIGACFGTWSLLAKACLPEASIHAFEPLNVHFDKFFRITEGVPDITLHKVALGSKSGTFDMYVNNKTDTSSFLETHELGRKEWDMCTIRNESVNTVVLDEYVITNRLPLPDLIKLDVQGYELEVMRGANNCLNYAKWILCEVSFEEYYKGQSSFHEVVAFLAKYRFHLYALSINTPLGQKLKQTDALFGRI